MKPEPSTIERFIARLPKDLQKDAMQVVVDELNRWRRGSLTKEEKKWLQVSEQMGAAASKTRENIIAETFISKRGG